MNIIRPQAASVPCRPIPAVIGVVLAIFLTILDVATRIELNVAVVYGLPLVFVAASRRPPVLWGLALALVTVTFVVYEIQVAQVHAEPARLRAGFLGFRDPYLAGRALAALAVLVTAAILQGWLFSLQTIDARDAAIEERDGRLEKMSLELIRREEEFTRKNVALETRRRAAEVPRRTTA